MDESSNVIALGKLAYQAIYDFFSSLHMQLAQGWLQLHPKTLDTLIHILWGPFVQATWAIYFPEWATVILPILLPIDSVCEPFLSLKQ